MNAVDELDHVNDHKKLSARYIEIFQSVPFASDNLGCGPIGSFGFIDRIGVPYPVAKMAAQ